MKNPIPGLKDKAYTLKSGMSKMSRMVLYTLIVSTSCMLLCSVILGIRSCQGNGYDFSTNEEALDFYRDYLRELRGVTASDAKSFCKEINRWTETKDNIIIFLARDTAFSSLSKEYSEYQDITDSVKNEFARLAETWKCSYNDIIFIKEGTTPFRDDQEIIEASQKADSLFRSLDEVKVPVKSKEQAIEDYRSFLIRTEKNGIESWADVTRFLINEDMCFRAFLAHLYELDGEHISDITEMTNRICHNIFLRASNNTIDKKKVVTYMAMRTVRRLLQNSTVCVNDISSRKLKSDLQANAYLWMIIQPFMSIDQLAIVTITPEGKQNLKYIADKLPKSTSFAKAFNIDQRSLSYLLPQQLLKMYIYSL